MQVATFVVAVLGLAISAVSMTWQVTSHVLTGRRVRTVLLQGALNPARGMVTTPHANKRDVELLASQGFNQPIIAVRVANIGRMPVTVKRWGLVGEPKSFTLWPTAMTIGEPLPFRLEAGESETWAVDMGEVHRFVTASAAAFEIPVSQVRVRGTVELGDGRTCVTRKDLFFAE